MKVFQQLESSYWEYESWFILISIHALSFIFLLQSFLTMAVDESNVMGVVVMYAQVFV